MELLTKYTNTNTMWHNVFSNKRQKKFAFISLNIYIYIYIYIYTYIYMYVCMYSYFCLKMSNNKVSVFFSQYC